MILLKTVSTYKTPSFGWWYRNQFYLHSNSDNSITEFAPVYSDVLIIHLDFKYFYPTVNMRKLYAMEAKLKDLYHT